VSALGYLALHSPAADAIVRADMLPHLVEYAMLPGVDDIKAARESVGSLSSEAAMAVMHLCHDRQQQSSVGEVAMKPLVGMLRSRLPEFREKAMGAIHGLLLKHSANKQRFMGEGLGALNVRASVYISSNRLEHPCVHVYVSVYACVHVYVSVYACVHVYVSVYACVHVYVSVYACVHVYVSVYACVHVCVSVYACVHVCIREDFPRLRLLPCYICLCGLFALVRVCMLVCVPVYCASVFALCACVVLCVRTSLSERREYAC
jgi:hypothetical protein